MLRLRIILTLYFRKASCLNKVITDMREGQHLFFIQFREEHLTAITKNTSQHTNLTRLLWRNKITLHIRWSCQRLFLLQTMKPSVRKRPVGKSHIGKTGSSYFEIQVICHHKIFHDTFRSPHNIDWIGSFVCRNTKKMFWRILHEKIHQMLCLYVVILDKSLNTIFVFFRTHMFVG